MNKGRTRDISALLPWLGLFLFAPPVLSLFHPHVTLAGLPLLPLYLFLVWLGLILSSWRLSKHLYNPSDTGSPLPDNQPHSSPPSPDKNDKRTRDA